jgi:signal transduction histidine kinase/DNA-binding response OmpR family regulator/ligand-binding sensor domain-containing protein
MGIVMMVVHCGYARNIIRQLSNVDGLSNSSVNCIFEDSEQTIWIGTWDGLNAYNGRDFKTWRYSNVHPHSISNNVIRQIMESDPLHIWIATDYGINKWNRETQHFTRYFSGAEYLIPKQEKSFLLGLTIQKDVVCYIKQQGLFFFDRKKDVFKPVKHFAFGDHVKTFVTDSENHIYFLYNDGRVQRFKLLTRNDNIELSQPEYIEQEKPVTNLFVTNDRLVIVYPDSLKITDLRKPYPATLIGYDRRKNISQVLFDRKNETLLVGYYEGGCGIYDPDGKTFRNMENLSTRTSVFSLYQGSQDILWVGTDGQGILKIYEHHSPFGTVYTNHPVRSFCRYDRDEILVGTKGEGIKRFNEKTHQLSDFLHTDNGLIANSVYTIKKNHAGDIFIGTEGAGVNVLSGKRLYRLNRPEKSPYFKAVYSICFTCKDSVLWLGTSGYGMIKISLTKNGSVYEAGNIEQYVSSDHPNALNNDVIYSIIAGRDENELWIGTRGGGVSRFNIRDETFEQIENGTENSFLTNNDVLSLIKSRENLWIGTSYGLNRFSFAPDSSSEMEAYTDREGLINNTIHGILEDENGHIWISTNQGISHINRQTKKIVNYSSKDGLQNDEFSDGACYKNEDHIFFFGGVNGFNYFNPNEIHLRDFEPTIGLSNLRIFNTSFHIAERIRDHTLKLSYDEAYVTLTFIAKDFINNENCEYNYRLLNFSEGWINNGNNPNVVFTRLPPGKYRLEVKATNGDKMWGKNVYTLFIDVASPWWLSATAVAVYAVAALCAFFITYSVIRNRIRLSRQLLLEQIERRNQQKIHESKLNFFTNVAHEFFTPLTLIYSPAQHLLEKTNPDSYTKRYIQIIKNNADRMQKLINELMEFRKIESGYATLHPENIDVKLLMDYISDNYTEIARENKIRFDVEIHSVSSIITDRNSLEKIVFNLISNAFKYTPANGYIHIGVTQDAGRKLYLHVRNSGKGLTEKQMAEIFNKFKIFESSGLQHSTSTGIGLGLTKSLTEMLNGKISVSGRLGEYVEFSLEIPPVEKPVSADAEPDTDSPVADVHLFEKKEISILIVEDEKNIRELLKDILIPYYSVNEANDGQEAIRIVAQNTPDMIISDILMPNLDGIKLIDALKSNPKTAHIPIINISAKSSVDDQINAYQHGADFYINKPFHPRQLLASIQNLIRKHSALKEYFSSSLSSVTIKEGVPMHQDDKHLLQEIISFIEKNMDDESLDPSAIADTLAVSKATLYRKLKDITGKTPSEFIRSIRLNHASELLKTTKMTVQEIMFKSGFSNKSYFYREFSKRYKVSPKEYRNSLYR